MPKATSVFLDVLRICAALTVFVGHCAQFWSEEWFSIMKHVGHDAVVVFFVLSGYVIAHSTLSKKRDAKTYALARLSRLYSVVLPALALTVGLMVLGTALNPDFYSGINRPHDGLRVILSGLFLQELWTISSSPPTNLPLWSLGYEFWYYAIFGAAVFVRPWGWKIVAVTALSLVVGYKVLVLLPIWLLGVLLYLTGRKVTLDRSLAQVGFVMATAAFFWVSARLPDFPVQHGFYPWFYSGAFITDFVTGMLLTAAIWCFDQGFGQVSVAAQVERGVRWVADHTFSLYLYHFPLIVFATAVVPFDKQNVGQCVAVGAGILAVILALSSITEAKRRAWHQGFAWLWSALENRFSRKLPPLARQPEQV